MKLTPWRFGCAVSTVWALCVFGAGLVNLYSPTYAEGFLRMLQSVYPGYHYGEWGFLGVLVVTLYAALDAFIVGVLVAWFYNIYTRLGRNRKD